MRIPRPDLDALIWLTGYEQAGSGQQLHAVKGADVYCTHSGALDVRELLWIDRAEALAVNDTTECGKCSQLDHRLSGTYPDEFVAIYGARQGEKDQDLLRHIRRLGQPEFSDEDYRIDIGRTEFPDGFGSFVTYWRRLSPSTERLEPPL